MKKWKALFWLVAIFFARDLLGMPFSNNIDMSDLIGLVISGISLIPLYGYAYQVAIGTKLTSTLIFLFNALAVLAGLIYGVILALGGIGMFQVLWFSFILAAFGAIYLYPQFMYAFKSNSLWLKNA
ncbi:hypothetical protein [Agarivorans gilvus]|uniref:Uncharacterized protein n=1 Tax=Agarivorans gilvus TaxID=680279 RepID=A0ABQ1I754_9ALTE|nr:hypothetical protein [Agarivorans gilvus]GGB21903.1 hypothetical protein GCM10007414_39130 [Agarivorans gilvus]